MNVSLTPELEQFIQRQVNAGKYNSPEEVVIKGIQLLAIMERFSQGSVEVLQPTQPKTEWMPGFFEEVIGGWVGEPLIREPRGEYETRETLF
ncbi:hypothetical protein MC7420_5052 [Coleofasciculus chthonoplastes PCC 7420]|uniref:Addiction module antidote protein, CC2985 family n=1 Tax=Coleofasciculus chthonoplastes PCC 7420 TaxID=118168 RepID=B4W1N3_9CYAN|nr:hypothetical protein [Coleofasciculus chthonoplastes]EDX71908.1 hypothetical protein MC7420_5052 [Coleofasciculus chthonoplastes PCC 7420]